MFSFGMDYYQLLVSDRAYGNVEYLGKRDDFSLMSSYG